MMSPDMGKSSDIICAVIGDTICELAIGAGIGEYIPAEEPGVMDACGADHC